MKRLELATKIRKYTKQSSTSLADAELLPMVNDAKNEMADLIAQADIKGNYFIVPMTDILIANQREYAWADDVLDHLYSIEFAFTPTVDTFGQLRYILCKPDDFRRNGVSRTEMNIQACYSNSKPRYELQRRSIYLLSGAIDATTLGASSIADAIRVRSRVYPADLPDLTDNTTDFSIDPTTTTFGFPKQFHELLARRVSIEWKGSHPGAVPLSPLESRYDVDLEAKLNGISENDLSGETLARNPYDDGSQY